MSRYPEGNGADVLRLESIISLFKQNGDNVFVISRGETTNFQIKRNGTHRYISFRSRENSFVRRLCDLLLYTSYLNEFLGKSKTNWDRIVIHGAPNFAIKFLKGFAKKRDIELIYDCVEWYSKEEYKLGRFNYEYIARNHLITKIIDHQFKVISISTYLEKYFQSRGIKTVRIPVILDVENIKYKKRKIENKLVVMYAGSPGGKDALDVMINGFRLLTDGEKEQIEFRIVGVDWNWLKKKYHYSATQIEEMNRYIRVYGRVDRDYVHELMEEADFSILLRPENLRYAKAGFPTKVVESLANGTPVICNLTSDLGMYIKEGYNGKVVAGCNAVSLSKVLKDLLNSNDFLLQDMLNGARRSSEDLLNIFKYKTLIHIFLKS